MEPMRRSLVWIEEQHFCEGGENVVSELGLTAADSLLSYLPLCHVDRTSWKIGGFRTVPHHVIEDCALATVGLADQNNGPRA